MLAKEVRPIFLTAKDRKIGPLFSHSTLEPHLSFDNDFVGAPAEDGKIKIAVVRIAKLGSALKPEPMNAASASTSPGRKKEPGP